MYADSIAAPALPMIAVMRGVTDVVSAASISEAMLLLTDISLSSAAISMLLRCMPDAPSKPQVESVWTYFKRADILLSIQQVESLTRIATKPSVSAAWTPLEVLNFFHVFNEIYNKPLGDGPCCHS